MNNIEFDLNKMSERLLKLEDENENLKVQVKQLKNFGEIQVGLNGKQARQIRQLVNENEKLNEHIKILSS
jgi:DNA-dependent RNA polymerase auxiliary subunit epsilon